MSKKRQVDFSRKRFGGIQSEEIQINCERLTVADPSLSAFPPSLKSPPKKA